MQCPKKGELVRRLLRQPFAQINQVGASVQEFLPGNIAQLTSYYLPAVLSLYRKILVEVSFLSACKSDLPQDRLFFATSECVSFGGGEGPRKCLSIINTFVPSIGMAQAMLLPQTDEQEGTHMAWLSVFSPALILFGFSVLILVIDWRTSHRR